MLQPILQFFSRIFPYTYARLSHWYLVLCYDHTRLFDFQSTVIAILPTCIYFLGALARNYYNDNEENPRRRPGPFRLLSDNVRYCTFIYNAINTIAGLDLVLRASGFWGKTLLAMDLFVESHLVVLANFVLFFSVGIFVGTLLEGLPFLMDLILHLWIRVEYIIHPPPEPVEADFEGNEFPADDPFDEEALLEEEVI